MEDGGQAFASNWNWEKGMSLRDYFAGQALAGIEANEMWFKEANDATNELRDGSCVEYFAQTAYEIADAMIAYRKQEIKKDG